MSNADAKQNYYALDCGVMHYDWGRRGPDALIHSLRDASGYSTEAAEPAAELWMGAHPKKPARLPDGTALDEAIRRAPAHFLGPDLAARGLDRLPFLFKILDAARPLSIQAHPDRELARRLHERDPANYPDDNHKPELAVCLAGMSALIGFRQPAEILRFFTSIPELAALCSPDGWIYESRDAPSANPADSAVGSAWLRKMYGQLMMSSSLEIKEAVQAHRLRLATVGEAAREDSLFLRLSEQYGDSDPGVFSVYFLNFVELRREEALFLGPNEPHAYLSGQILECMAASDNVVRAGLTSKFMDVRTLLQMLHYGHGSPGVRRPVDTGDGRGSYPVETEDFAVFRLELGYNAVELREHARPSIVIALEKEFQLRFDGPAAPAGPVTVPRGGVIFFPGDLASRSVTVRIESSHPSFAYQATVGAGF